MAYGVGIVGIFLACSDLRDPLFEQVVWAQVDPSRVAWVGEHGSEGSRSAQWLIRIFEQDKTGIRRQTAPRKVECNSFGPDRRQE